MIGEMDRETSKEIDLVFRQLTYWAWEIVTGKSSLDATKGIQWKGDSGSLPAA